MLKEHHFFETPEDAVKIWRYLSLTKYLSMLTTQTVYFRRADRLEDPFEGIAPDTARTVIEQMFSGEFENAAEMARQYMALNEAIRRFTFLNCWHVNDAESDAMWKLYSLANEGVAIQSTVGRLKQWVSSASESFFIGLVRYANHDELSPEVFLNGVTPYIHKRKSFEHERELRILLWFEAAADDNGDYPKESSLSGRSIPVQLDELVESVYVSPLAEPWFNELVANLTERFGLTCPVVQSRLYTRSAAVQSKQESTVDASPSMLTGAVIDQLHAQHLQYVDQRHREQERLARRQYAVIERWLRSIERDVEQVTYLDSGGVEHRAKQAFLNFADDVIARPLGEIVPLTIFRLMFSLTGRFANAFSELQRSVLPEGELLLLAKRIFILYCETIYSTHVLILSKREDVIEREDDAAMVDAMARQGQLFMRVMKALSL